MKSKSTGGSASVSESLTGYPVGLPNEGHGIYAPMEHTNCTLQRDLEIIHDRLAAKGIHPYRIETGSKRVPVVPYSWGKIR